MPYTPTYVRRWCEICRRYVLVDIFDGHGDAVHYMDKLADQNCQHNDANSKVIR